MIYLVLAILSSACVSIFMRASEKYCSGRYSILLINYAACMVSGLLSSGNLGRNIGISGTGTAVGFGIVTGLLYLASFILLQWNVRKNGVILSSTFMKLGVIVPTLTAIFWFREKPVWNQYAGIVLAVFAILLMNLEKQTEEKQTESRMTGGKGAMAGLLLLLLGGGMGDSMAKFYDAYGKAELSDLFLIICFCVSGMVCAGLTVKNREKIEKEDILFGILIGVPNYFSAKFLLKALTEIPAVVTYPTYSIAAMMVIGVAGVCIFKETLTKRQWMSYIIVLASIAFLNI